MSDTKNTKNIWDVVSEKEFDDITRHMQQSLGLTSSELREKIMQSDLLTRQSDGPASLMRIILGKTEGNRNADQDAKWLVDGSVYTIRSGEKEILTLEDGVSLSFLTASLEEGLRTGSLFTLSSNQKALVAFLSNTLAKIYENIVWERNGIRKRIDDIEPTILETQNRELALLDLNREFLLELAGKGMEFFRQRMLTGRYVEEQEALLAKEQAELEVEVARIKAEIDAIHASSEYVQASKKIKDALRPENALRDEVMESFWKFSSLSDDAVKKIAKELDLDSRDEEILLYVKRVAGVTELKYIENSSIVSTVIDEIVNRVGNAEYNSETQNYYPGFLPDKTRRTNGGGMEYEKVRSHEMKPLLTDIFAKLAKRLGDRKQMYSVIPSPSPVKQISPEKKQQLRGGTGSGGFDVLKNMLPAKPAVPPENERKLKMLDDLMMILAKEPTGLLKEYRQAVAVRMERTKEIQAKLDELNTRAITVRHDAGMEKKEHALKYTMMHKRTGLENMKTDMEAAQPVIEQSYKEVCDFLDPSQTNKPAGLYTVKAMLMLSDKREKSWHTYPNLEKDMREFQSFNQSRPVNPVYAFSEYTDNRHDKLHYYPRHMPFLDILVQYIQETRKES